jgi:hypothetical protein
MNKGYLNREVTMRECHWLQADLPKGKVVYEYTGHAYNCTSASGVAVCDNLDDKSSYEVPETAVDWVAPR